MRFASTATGRPAWSKFHEERRRAREEYMNEDEASSGEQVDFAIDEDDDTYPLGGLPSEMRDENYIVEDPVSGESYDYRDAHDTV